MLADTGMARRVELVMLLALIVALVPWTPVHARTANAGTHQRLVTMQPSSSYPPRRELQGVVPMNEMRDEAYTTWKDGFGTDQFPSNGGPFNDVARSIYWADLEPSSPSAAGVHTYDWTEIDRALVNAAGVKLRIYAGIRTPAWLIARSDPNPGGFTRYSWRSVTDSTGRVVRSCWKGVAVYWPLSEKRGCVPFFWSATYLRNYRALLAAIAARYGGTASPPANRLLEVTVSACMTIFAEPLWRSAAMVKSLTAAGMTFQDDVRCELTALTAHKTTLSPVGIRSSLALNDWGYFDPVTGSYETAWSVTVQYLLKSDQFTSFNSTGSFLSVGANELNASEDSSCPLAETADTSRWCWLRSYAGPKYMQTTHYSALNGSSSSLDPSGWAAATYLTLDKAAAVSPAGYQATYCELHQYPLRQGPPYPPIVWEDAQYDFDREVLRSKGDALAANAAH